MSTTTSQLERPTGESRFWDRMSKNYDTSSKSQDANATRRLQQITSLVDEADEVLDFACATGDIGLNVAPYVARVLGIDTSKKMIATAKAKRADHQSMNIDFKQTDIFDPALAQQSFSAILAFNIFHLLDDTQSVLHRLNELLIPGGLLISNTPCLGEANWALRSMVSLAASTKFAPNVRNLKVAELETSITNQNFKIIESKAWNTVHNVQWILARTPWQ